MWPEQALWVLDLIPSLVLPGRSFSSVSSCCGFLEPSHGVRSVEGMNLAGLGNLALSLANFGTCLHIRGSHATGGTFPALCVTGGP